MPLTKAKTRWGYFIAFILLLLSYFLIFLVIRKLAQESDRVSHSFTVINSLEKIKGELTDAETGIRGYFITRNEQYLSSYHTGRKNVIPHYENLRRLTAEEPTYKARVLRLGQLIPMRLATLDTALAVFKRQGELITPVVTAPGERNRVMMDSIRHVIHELRNDEQTLMNERDDNLRGFFTTTSILALTSLLVALVTIAYSVVIYNRESKAKEKAISNTRLYSMQLEERVSELANLNVELQELKSIEKFASTGRIARTIAHEVRNPLTNISLASEQLRELVPGNEEAALLLDMIGRNSSRINQLVSDLLQSTRFAQLEYTVADINELLEETLTMAKDRLELHQVKLEKKFAQNLCKVPVDREKIRLAFLNIIVNAIEAMEKGKGVLRVTTRLQGDKCLIEFSDNGSGMDEETLQKLFEPYFTSKLKGNGLGLTNTQNIILNHKGTISAQSVKGEGSRFIVVLNTELEESI